MHVVRIANVDANVRVVGEVALNYPRNEIVEVLRCGSGCDLCAFTTNNTDKEMALSLSVIFRFGL
jgi:hypothetical protein